MKMSDAMDIINKKKQGPGYRVYFEKKQGSFLYSDYFPTDDEPLIKTEKRAWELAKKFAANTIGRCVNFYIVDGNYSPVRGYKEKMIENR